MSEKSKPALVVLAAGMGSRFGGVKQIQPVGPQQEIILEYSVYDAIQAGFESLVCVIRKDIEADFVEHILKRFDKKIDCKLVFQSLDALPAGFSVPAGREKPWGTGHAVLMAKNAVRGPFAVINADDFYGKDGFKVLGSYLSGLGTDSTDYAMVGYQLAKTVSEHGSVSRGVCELDTQGWLSHMVEHTKISVEAGPDKRIVSLLPDGTQQKLAPSTIVSMNLFGFTPRIFGSIEQKFEAFLRGKGASDPKAELYIPFIVDEDIRVKQARLKVLSSSAEWFGITYREDLPLVVDGLKRMHSQGAYPSPLW